mmetsp:Transcript_14447/g.31336  ORF Transcript_14447/g.31336 Transcript_14447/m.31336 type:complete len:498 (-) Transcript_14447:88-1581(-)|eukprot:CAMPEP_0172331104 /NCGR_PEP_ID=MMETSP1058-20130122/61754_1 /TAXON_ID=83371 /ORGANISM="Detonula confervacea, Strain CCMP 353" /LENGTH=497 /DNA_ID=CAMNT_0013048357 /DNA_START=96 /DNA_END=1589 /DNA_ORIENTATION=+
MWSGQFAGAQQQQNSADSDVNIASDVFGHTAYLDGLASKININSALAEMQTELSAMPATEKVALTQVQRLKPQLLDDEHVLQFLWAENFSTSDAARRLARYWNDRYKLFGPDKFLLPMTLKGALKDDSLALSRGYVQLLPETDTAGRAVVYIDWSSHEPSVGYSEESMHRVFWYMAHVAMEDSNVLQRGVVLLIYPQEARLDQFDHSLWNSIAESCKKSLPLRWRSTHIVHPNRFFSIIHPVFMSSLPKHVQDRVVVHSGTKMKVLANLLRYCLPWDRIPSEIGGCIDLDFEKWLSDRMLKEDQTFSFQKPPVNLSSSALGDAVASSASGALGVLQQMIQPNSIPDHATSGSGNAMQSAQKQQAFGNNVNQFLNNLSQSSNAAERANEATLFAQAGLSGTATNQAVGKAKVSVAKGPKLNVKSGRKSDPRMDKAVQAKLDDSALSLLDALRQGGFIFPALDESSTPQYAVVDSDNVKITQRKNQLLRRIRTAKKKIG